MGLRFSLSPATRSEMLLYASILNTFSIIISLTIIGRLVSVWFHCTIAATVLNSLPKRSIYCENDLYSIRCVYKFNRVYGLNYSLRFLMNDVVSVDSGVLSDINKITINNPDFKCCDYSVRFEPFVETRAIFDSRWIEIAFKIMIHLKFQTFYKYLKTTQ